MVLSYLRWEADALASFGLLCSPQCAGVVFLKQAGWAVAGAGEAVAVWQLKSGALMQRLLPEGRQYSGVGARPRPQVTHLRAHPTQPDVAAAGYSDGSVRLWNVRSGKELVALSGHRGLVTALCFSADGSRLYTGGADTDIVCWDIVAESGLFRLRGHKGPITDLLLLERSSGTGAAGALEHAHLVSASKDTLVKVWDLATQAAVQTLVGHRAEVTALAANAAENLLVTGAAEGPLRVWRIHPNGRADPPAPVAAKEKKITVKLEPGLEPAAAAAPSSSAAAAASSSSSDSLMSTEGTTELLRFWGFLPRDSKRRVTSLTFWPQRSENPSLLISTAADKQIDLFHVREQSEVDKKVKRRIKRQREKAKKHATKAAAAAAASAGGEDTEMADASAEGVAANGGVVGSIPIDQFQALLPLRTTVKVVAVSASTSAAHLRLLLAMSDNSIQCWSVDLAGARITMDEREAAAEGETSATALTAAAVGSGALLSSHYAMLYSLNAAGHRSGIRVCCLNSDGTALMTASGEQVKLWNVVSKTCIRTMESGYALCGAFVPGSRHVLIGTKAGEIELYDLATGSCIQKVAAHVSESGAPVPVYALDLRPDQKGFATGGGDKEVKVWDFELVLVQADPDSPPVRSLQIVLSKTLRLTDDVLCLRHSPDGKLLAVGLLDSTIKLFYADSLKFFLSLYGHKLPVLAIDISSDSNMLVSGSADKNVKLWGLDFGDCTSAKNALPLPRDVRLDGCFHCCNSVDSHCSLSIFAVACFFFRPQVVVRASGQCDRRAFPARHALVLLRREGQAAQAVGRRHV
jgi:U3 small nucleolar RNA-associated protein 12